MATSTTLISKLGIEVFWNLDTEMYVGRLLSPEGEIVWESEEKNSVTEAATDAVLHTEWVFRK